MTNELARREDRIPGPKALSIFVRSWRPEREPRAVVFIVHGFNSHSGYYEWTAERLVAAGYAVYALDLHGRGQSDGDRFFTESFADYLADVEAALALARSREAGLPVFLLGHSAGGVIASNFALDHQSELAGLICESFAFRVYAPNFALTALEGLSKVAPRLRVLTLPNDKFSRDRAAVEFMNADPLIAGEKQPTLTVAEMWRADQRLEREFGRLTLPVLILHGTEDKVTKPEGSRMFHERAGSADKTLKLYEGHYHDLLADVGRETVMADILSWIDARAPRPVRSEVAVDYPLGVDDPRPGREGDRKNSGPAPGGHADPSPMQP
jgi:alpha-beta hydrolase superfamily lysophospholipase